MYEEAARSSQLSQPTWNGIPLPLMPSKPILRAAYQYERGQQFTLCSNPKTPVPEEVVIIKVEKPISIGYGYVSQIVLAKMESGSNDIVGKMVIVKFFDPLYLCPDNLSFVDVVGSAL
jgi:hypothetical protein